MAHATRATLVTCLRVSRDVHDSAGAVLYHTVRIHGSNLEGLLDGCWWEDGLVERGQPDAPTISTSRLTDFKNRLLTRIRVVTIGTHEWYLCEEEEDPGFYRDAYYTISLLLRNVHTVRIVQSPKHSHLRPLCLSTQTTCRFLTLLNPRKLVIRNVSWPGVCDYSGYWRLSHNATHICQLTWILPTSRPEGAAHCYFQFGHKYGPIDAESPVVKMVYHAGWETWAQLPPPTSNSPAPIATVVRSFSRYDFIRFFCKVKSFAKPHLTAVYGLEIVNFGEGPNDPAVRRFKGHFPSETVTSDILRQMVKDETVAPSGLPASVLNSLLSIVPLNIQYTFKSLADYAALDPAGTRFELDDEYRS